MQKQRISILLLVFLSFFACKKQEIGQDSIGTPEFFVDATLGNTPLNFTAGLDNIYLYTEASADDSVQLFQAHFAQANCRSCPNSLEFLLTYPNSSSTIGPNADEKVVFSSPLFGGIVEDTFYTLSLNVSPTNDQFAYTWQLGPANNAQGSSATAVLSGSQTYTAQLRITDTLTNSQYTVESEIPLPNVDFCSIGGLSIISDTGNSLIFGFDIASSFGNRSYSWSTGETQSAINILQAGTYCVTVSDTLGCTQNFCATVDPAENHPFTFIPNIIYEVDTEIITNMFQNQFGVRIRYVDADNILWDSELGQQNSDATFEILNRADYELNENNAETQELEIAFMCQLFNEQGDGRNFFGTGQIAVGK